MASLYQIDRALLELVDPETGEIENWEAFDQLQMEREQKIENVACWYKNLVAEAAAIRQEELNLQKRRKEIEAQAERRKKYLEDALCGQKFSSARCAISFRKTTKVDVTDPEWFIQWCERNDHRDLVTYAAPSVNKTEVAKLLKAQVDLPCVELVEGLSMGVK